MNAVDLPKVMYPINGKPMIGYLADMLEKAGVEKSIAVVGFQGQKVIDYLSDRNRFKFVWQKELLGTGHALMQAREELKNKEGVTVVLNGDNPFYTAASLKKLANKVALEKAVMAVASVKFDPSFSFGRIITDSDGHINRIVEVKNCTPEQLKLEWMNAGLYAFDNSWLWKNIDKIEKNSVSSEYYITDLVEIADSKGDRVVAVPVSHTNEAIGINTLDNLKAAEQALGKK